MSRCIHAGCTMPHNQRLNFRAAGLRYVESSVDRAPSLKHGPNVPCNPRRIASCTSTPLITSPTIHWAINSHAPSISHAHTALIEVIPPSLCSQAERALSAASRRKLALLPSAQIALPALRTRAHTKTHIPRNRSACWRPLALRHLPARASAPASTLICEGGRWRRMVHTRAARAGLAGARIRVRAAIRSRAVSP